MDITKKHPMKSIILKSFVFGSVALLLGAAFTTSSCRKDKTCHGKVHVVDTLNRDVANALVKLSAPSVQGQVVYDGTTDNSGVVRFEVKLPAIFDVTATKATYPGQSATGVLRLDEPGKDAEVTVTMQ